MNEKGKTKQNDNTISECILLLDKSFDGLIARSQREEVYSEDLTEGLVPVLSAMKTMKTTYISHLNEHIKVSGIEAVKALDDFVKATGSIDMLHAAIATGKIPAEGVVTKFLTLPSGEKVKTWLIIIKEIIEFIINHLPIPLPGWLKDGILELLDILDKIFGGKVHDRRVN
jgi:hypothetical protein